LTLDSLWIRGDYFRFGSVFIKKSNQTETEPKSGQTDQFCFGLVWFFRAKTCSNQFGLFFPVLARFSWFWLCFFRFWLGFFGLVWFFRFDSVFLFFVGFSSVQFFQFFNYKTETKPNRPVLPSNNDFSSNVRILSTSFSCLYDMCSKRTNDLAL